MNLAKLAPLFLAVVIGLGLSAFSFNPQLKNQLASVITLPSTTPVITKFVTTYQIPSGIPQVTWTVNGPAGTTCNVLEGSNNATHFILPTQSSGSVRVLTNPNISRNITLTCTGGGKSVSAYATVPKDIDTINATNGSSITPLAIGSLTVVPANRSVNTAGTLAWSVDCGPLVTGSPRCSCGLSYGSTKDQVVSLSATKTVSNTTNSATTYRLTCVTADGGKRQSQFLTDTIGTGSTPTPSTDTRITSFTALPSPRAYNQSAQLAWTTTNATKCRLSGASLSNVNVSVQSSIETGSAKYISPLTVAPTATSTVQYTLQCDNGKTGTSFKLDTASTTSVTNPKATGSTSGGGTNTTPPPPTNSGGYKNGTHAIVPGSDAYATYNLPSAKPDTNQLRVRIAEKIPGLALSGQSQPSLWASLFAQIVEAASPLTVDIFKDGGSNYFTRPVMTVPYWTNVKFQWRWAQRTQMDATKDAQLPNNLPGGDWCGYIKDVEKQCAVKYPDTKSKEYDGCLNSKIAYPAQAVVFDNYDLTNKQYKNWKMLYEAGFKSCEEQFPSGEWEWSPTPEDRTKTVQVTNQIWGPNGNTPFNFLPTWLPKVSDSGTQRYVTVVGYKCEKPFEGIVASLNNGQVTDITEDGFKKWADDDVFDKYYQTTVNNGVTTYTDVCGGSNKADPTKCNSGNKDDIKKQMSVLQACYVADKLAWNATSLTGTEYDNALRFSREFTAMKSKIKSHVSKGNPVSVVYSLVIRARDVNNNYRYQPMGAHVVIALSINESGLGFNLEIFDSNLPGIRSLECEKTSLPGFMTGNLVTKCDGYMDSLSLDGFKKALIKKGFNPVAVDVIYILTDNPVDPIGSAENGFIASRNSFCSGHPNNNLCAKTPVERLKGDFPVIQNFGSPESPGGVCFGHSKFLVQVAYLGNFIGECPRP